MKKILLLTAAAVLALLAGLSSFLLVEKPDSGVQRIDFQMTDMQGRLRHASEWDGQVVLINFWAPWCAPCRAEIPLLIDLQKRYAENGLQILGPALDKPEAVEAFAEEYGMNYPLFADMNAVMDLQEAYGDTRLPYTVLLNRQGDVAYTHAGELEAAEIEAWIKRIITAESDDKTP